MAAENRGKPLILGLDLGTNSIGWALVRDGEKIVASGVRIFEAGTAGTSDQIAAGKDEPRGAQRRQARLARRMLARRAQRLRSVFRLLGEAGLLPKCETGDPAERNRVIDALDERLRNCFFGAVPGTIASRKSFPC